MKNGTIFATVQYTVWESAFIAGENKPFVRGLMEIYLFIMVFI